MAYVSPNFKSKAALKRALAAGENVVCISNSEYHQPPANGFDYVEGPHFPAPHSWYGKVKIENSRVVSVT